MNKKLGITLNSTMLYVIAFLLTTILHEFFHALSGIICGSSPVMHHNYVVHFSIEQLSVSQKVFIALAGPTISLIQGIGAGFAYLKSSGQKPIHLFLLWFAVLGFNNFLGYLITGPLFKKGDIGKAYLLLDTPLWIQIIIAVSGAALLLLMAYKLTAPFLKFSYNPEWTDSGTSRKNFSFYILILPWIIGSGIITVLYLPIIALISIIYPVMSGMIFIFPWQNAERIKQVPVSTHKGIGKPSVITFCVLVILTVAFKTGLAPGIKLY